MYPKKIDSVKDLFNRIDLVPDDEPEYVYRGESKAYDKPCSPLLFRCLDKGNGLEFDGGVDQELMRVRRWKEETELSEGAHLPCKTDLEAMILARHYGVRVRLLDWSSNPLVSFWFAANSNSEEDGCIYSWQNTLVSLDFTKEMVEGNKLSDRRNALELNPSCLKLPQSDTYNRPALEPFFKTHFFRPRSLPNSRVLSQCGLISIHPNPNDDDNFFPFRKFVIPAESKSNFLRELAVLGINERSLGLSTRDGIAKRLNKSQFPWE